MEKLLTFFGSIKRDPAIDEWFETKPPELAAIGRAFFDVMRNCGSNVRELLHDGHPTVVVNDAAFAYVNIFTSHVNVGFFLGAGLPDPAGLLQGTGKRMRHIKLRPANEYNTAAITALIEAAYADILVRVKS